MKNNIIRLWVDLLNAGTRLVLEGYGSATEPVLLLGAMAGRILQGRKALVRSFFK